MTNTVYRSGEELTPETLLLSLARMHGLESEVRGLLSDKAVPKLQPPVDGLGPLLTRTRMQTGITVEEIHKRSSISRSQISFYERGYQKNPGLRTIQALSYGYRLPFSQVMMAVLWDIRPRAKIRKRNRDG